MTVQQQITHERLDSPGTPQRYRFRQQDYVLLDRAGAFREYGKTELIDGVIFGVNAQFSRHARAHGLLYQAFVGACARRDDDLSAWVECSVALAEDSMPQPDIAVTHGLPDDGPIPKHRLAIIVEIADSSLDFDLNRKQEVYAAAGVPEYWIADVNARTIRQMWQPDGAVYNERREIAFGTAIEAATIDGFCVKTSDL